MLGWRVGARVEAGWLSSGNEEHRDQGPLGTITMMSGSTMGQWV